MTRPCAGVDLSRHDSLNRRGFDMIDLDSAGFAEFMKADDDDNGKAPKRARLCRRVRQQPGAKWGCVLRKRGDETASRAG